MFIMVLVDPTLENRYQSTMDKHLRGGSCFCGKRRGEPLPRREARNSMRKISTPISLAGSQLGQSRHVCAFFNSDEEEYRVLLPFIKDGFERDRKSTRLNSSH